MSKLLNTVLATKYNNRVHFSNLINLPKLMNSILYGIIITIIHQNISNTMIKIEALKNNKTTVDYLPQFIGQIIINPLTPRNGDNVSLACPIKDLGKYKITWSFIDKQTLISIQNYVFVESTRIEVKKEINGEISKWNLIIKNVSLTDSGYYICQINTYPPKRLLKFLNIFVAPEFDNNESFESDSTLTVKEYENITLTCKATGNPKPIISWKKENGEEIHFVSQSLSIESKDVVYSEVLFLGEVNRRASGDYVCIAANDISPSIRRRVSLNVYFSPTIIIPRQLVSVPIGHNITLYCITESNPMAQHFWINSGNKIISDNRKYIIEIFHANLFKAYFKLTINDISLEDSGDYICVAINKFGQTKSILILNANESYASSFAAKNLSSISPQIAHIKHVHYYTTETTKLKNNSYVNKRLELDNKSHVIETNSINFSCFLLKTIIFHIYFEFLYI